ncbi:hypothetical protein NEOC95_001125 [Neochlamydia sp. AcF95]|nr:hypothetical protein [Neochlamydia sp. AcF95]
MNGLRYRSRWAAANLTLVDGYRYELEMPTKTLMILQKEHTAITPTF